MSKSTQFVRCVAVVIALMLLWSPRLALAQRDPVNTLCTDLARLTDELIVVEVPDVTASQGAVGCNIHRIVSRTIAGVNEAVEVFIIRDGFTVRGVFPQPVRVCFHVESPADATLFFHDARFPGITRESYPMSPIPAGYDLGFACGDADRPGTVRLTGTTLAPQPVSTIDLLPALINPTPTVTLTPGA